MQSTHVETYSGYRADERPLRFRFNDRVLQVLRIAEQRREPQMESFRVAAEDNKEYWLRHHLSSEQDSWTVEEFDRDTRPVPPGNIPQ